MWLGWQVAWHNLSSWWCVQLQKTGSRLVMAYYLLLMLYNALSCEEVAENVSALLYKYLYSFVCLFCLRSTAYL